MTDRVLLKYLEDFISPERIARFREILENRTRLLTVVTEDVFQLHNTSAVIRSCDIFGIQDLHMIEAQFGNRLDKNIAVGAQQWVSLHRHPSTKSCLETLRTQGYTIVATSPDHPDSIPLEEFKIQGKTAICFGTEKEGLSSALLSRADTLLKIPMVGFTQSLNISVAVAIILYRLSAQVRDGRLSWELSEEEKLELQLEWTKNTIKSIDEIMERYQNKS